jgi:hypothetical protein
MNRAELAAAPSRGTGKRVRDIEDVLRWAYQDELPKRGSEPTVTFASFHAAPREPNPNDFDDVADYREPGFPAALGDPHPDALLVRAAVNGLKHFRVRDLQDVGLGLKGADEAAAIEEAMPKMAGTVERCAKLGARPTIAPAPELRPVRARNGAVKMVRKETHYILEGRVSPKRRTKFDLPIQVEVECKATRGGAYPPGAYPLQEWSSDPKIAARSRAEYLVWWAALKTLAQELAGKLTSIAVLEPSAPARPWAGDRELGKPVSIFNALRAPAQTLQGRAAAEAIRHRGDRRAGDRRRHSTQAVRFPEKCAVRIA